MQKITLGDLEKKSLENDFGKDEKKLIKKEIKDLKALIRAGENWLK